jgi:hypothetical protein
MWASILAPNNSMCLPAALFLILLLSTAFANTYFPLPQLVMPTAQLGHTSLCPVRRLVTLPHVSHHVTPLTFAFCLLQLSRQGHGPPLCSHRPRQPHPPHWSLEIRQEYVPLRAHAGPTICNDQGDRRHTPRLSPSLPSIASSLGSAPTSSPFGQLGRNQTPGGSGTLTPVELPGTIPEPPVNCRHRRNSL